MQSGDAEWSGAGLLRQARLGAGLTQAQLAVRAGVPRTMVSAYERDLRQPTLPTLVRLLRAAGFELRVRLVPSAVQDDVLREMEQQFTTTEHEGQQSEIASRADRERRRRQAAEQAKRRQAGGPSE